MPCTSTAVHCEVFVIGCCVLLGWTSGLSSEAWYWVNCRELAFQLADQFRALGAGITLKVRSSLAAQPHPPVHQRATLMEHTGVTRSNAATHEYLLVTHYIASVPITTDFGISTHT